jgi:hypothetical protein
MPFHTDNTTSATESSDECRHVLETVGRIGVIACGSCGLLEFFGARGPLDPAEGVAGLFGNFDLVGPLEAVGAPSRRVLVYRPARGRKAALAVLPEGVWLRAGADLWIASDGRVLMLATPNDLMVDNLTRGA